MKTPLTHTQSLNLTLTSTRSLYVHRLILCPGLFPVINVVNSSEFTKQQIAHMIELEKAQLKV